MAGSQYTRPSGLNRAGRGPRSESGPLAQKDVGRAFARDQLRAFVAQSAHIDVVQEMLPQILPNPRHATTQADVAAARCSGRLLQSGVNACADKVKFGPA